MSWLSKLFRRNDPTPEQAGYVKITFPLTREGDWPPVDTEGLWAREIGPSEYVIDNIPWFSDAVALEDIVIAHDEGDTLTFQRVVSHSGRSVMRVVCADPDVAPLRERLDELGCTTEHARDPAPNIIAIDIPPDADLDRIEQLLQKGADDGRWGFYPGYVAP